jgi:Putative phage tail protein
MSGLFGGGRSNAQQPTAAAGIRVQTSIYGKAVALVYGNNRVSGNVIWYGDFKATSHSQSAGGKGGSGSSTSYTYTTALIIALCEGSIYGIGRVWQNSEVHTPVDLGLSIFTGTYPQAPWGYLATNHPTQALGYSGVAYVAHGAYNLQGSPSLPNLSFEVFGLYSTPTTPDIPPSTVLTDFLSDPNHGVGWNTSWLGNWTAYTTYCAAANIAISPVIDTQTQSQQLVQDILDSTNSNCFWSEGVLKVVPYADMTVSNGTTTYTPNVTPVYALNDDNFIFQSGQDPVQVTRSSPQDAYNIVDVECVDRNNSYATYLAEAKDTYAISAYGPRPDTVRQYHHIVQPALAQQIAQTLLQRDQYIRNTYQFKLGWMFCGLEPMDLVTLTDTRMGLNNVAVRITAIQEDQNGVLTFTAEEFPAGVATPATYSAQQGQGTNINFNVAAPNINQAVFYEPPGQVTNNQPVLWLGVAGTGNWGGCDIWVSVDGVTYTRQGTVHGSARTGVLSAALPLAADPDLTDTLAVDLTNSAGVLNSGSQADADSYNTLCVAGEELVSYETAALTATSKYNLTYLRRGAYGTAEATWPVGAPFMRVDQSVFTYPFDSSVIGSPLYFKFVSFNQYGGGAQNIATVPVFTYTVQGSALNAALANVTGLYTNFVAGITQLFWSPITDYRAFDYEVRKGLSWGSGQTMGRTTGVSFPTSGDGTYWVAAHYRNPNGYDVYSASPAQVTVTGSILVQNTVASYDEVATGWTGTLSGGAAIAGGQLTLQGTGNFLTVSNVLTMTDVLHYGGIAPSGGYALPSGHAVNVGRVAPCSVRLNFTGYAQSITDNVLTIPNILAATDLLDASLGKYVTITPQIAVAQAGGVYGAWQNYQPGTYTGQFFKAQMLLTSADATITPLVTALTFAVDIPTRVDTFTNQSIVAAGTTLSYPNGAFNSGPNGAATPNVQVTILNASQGDTVVLSGKTLSQVTVQVLNAGSGVARTTDINVTGY